MGTDRADRQRLANRLDEIEYELVITFDNLYGGPNQKFCYRVGPVLDAIRVLQKELREE